MIWLDRTKIGFVFFVIVGILVGCKDDQPFIGFKRGGSDKFTISKKEIVLPSSVFLADSVRTDYRAGSVARLMVGRYDDPDFGMLRTQAYFQFRPYAPVIKITDDAQLTSSYLLLSFDTYHYGSQSTSTSTFNVHELTDSIKVTPPYLYSSQVAFDPAMIGTVTRDVDPSNLDALRDKIATKASSVAAKDMDSLKINLAMGFASKLFQSAREQTSSYTDFREFRKTFYGLTIVPGVNDSHIVGFNPKNASSVRAKSVLVLNYEEKNTAGKIIKKTLVYSLYSVGNAIHRGFTHIASDRSGTLLSALGSSRVEHDLNGVRYGQSGNPIVTKLDFGEFLTFADEIPNIIFNAVRVVIDIKSSSQHPPPSSLRLRLLDVDNNWVYITSKTTDGQDIARYSKSMTIDEEGYYIVGQRYASGSRSLVSNTMQLNYDKEKNSYIGDFTLFFQSLRDTEELSKRHRYWGLVANNPWIGYSVDRFTFAKDDVMLDVLYTVPVVGKK